MNRIRPGFPEVVCHAKRYDSPIVAPLAKPPDVMRVDWPAPADGTGQGVQPGQLRPVTRGLTGGLTGY